MATPGESTPSSTEPGPPPTGSSAISSQMTADAEELEVPSELSSQRGTWSQPPGSRRGVPPPNTFGGARSPLQYESSEQASSRPQTSASRVSRTHVPTLPAHGFFRPMSSQRLQAQRGARPTTKGQSVASEDGQSDNASLPNRQSIGSNPTTIRQGPFIHQQQDEAPPPSRGTEFTDPVITDREISNASPTGNTTVRSLGESVRLLHNRSNTQPKHLDISKSYIDAIPPQKSPRSFRSGFRMPSRNEPPRHDDVLQGHERLSSGASTPRLGASKPPPIPTKNAGRNHEYFQGNTIFGWGGRLQNSRDRPINIATAIFVIAPAVLFLVYSAPWLWHNVSPAIPILFGYTFFVCMSSFVHASVVDPGIYPRNLHQMPPADPSDDPLALGPPTNDWAMIRMAGSSTAAMDVPVKYCKTCNIWRPPRCYHCRVCDNCVETLDHHCVWLNNCVGRRNYRYFMAFVASATILGLFLIGASLGHVLAYREKEHLTFRDAIVHLRVPFAMVIYGVLGIPYPAALWFYHLFLTSRGETTREYLNSHKFPKADRFRPYSQGGPIKNWLSILMRPRPPTYLHFKQRYIEGDQRLGPRRVKGQPGRAKDGAVELQNVAAIGTGTQPSFQGPSARKTPPADPQ